MTDRRYVLWVTLVVLVLLLNLPGAVSSHVDAGVQDGVSPFLALLSGATGSLQRALAALRGDIPGRDELEAEVARLRQEVRRLRSLEKENESLRRAMGFARRSHRLLIPCRVVARGDVSGWWQTLRLNKGRRDNIGPNMPVVTANGLVGRTINVSAGSCDVLLLTDHNCRVSAKLLHTGDMGILRGAHESLGGEPLLDMLVPPGTCRMEYVAGDTEVKTGAPVVTSGLGDVFPPGLLIGHVERTATDPSGLYQTIRVRMSANLQTPEYLFVVVE